MIDISGRQLKEESVCKSNCQKLCLDKHHFDKWGYVADCSFHFIRMI